MSKLKGFLLLLITLCFVFNVQGKDKIGLLFGTFNPPTNGHVALVNRASKIADKLYVYVCESAHKKPKFTMKERVDMVKEVVDKSPNIIVVGGNKSIDTLIKEYGVNFLIRGLRNMSDFSYEIPQAIAYRNASKIETVFIATDPKNCYTCASLVRQTAKYGHSIAKYIPKSIVAKVEKRLRLPATTTATARTSSGRPTTSRP